ncbi:FxsA family protein [Alginatibacterium sediminis]|uniref:FxsA family protein n=1 Tax=Alginatibacterium sediminis TaxID=2164068 RepID=UPI0013146B81|nr:FxsA family protein [Alginatibacterium sediminis]
MILYLFLIIAGLSFAEMYVLIEVGSQLGALPTIALTILTAIVGASLVRSQGLKTAFEARASMDRGEVPALQMFEGLMLVVAGGMLVMPGFITDFCGMILLIKPIRELIARRWIIKNAAKFEQAQRQQGFNQGDNPGSHTIEGEYERKDDDRLN